MKIERTNIINQAIKYANDIISEEIIAGKYIILACKRFLDDLKREDLILRRDIISKYESFISKLRFDNREKFELLPFQCFIAVNILGLYYKDGRRKYLESYIQMARKNGKVCRLY